MCTHTVVSLLHDCTLQQHMRTWTYSMVHTYIWHRHVFVLPCFVHVHPLVACNSVPPQTVRTCSLMRSFVCRVATHILAFEGDSQVTWFEGSYSEYEQYKRQQAGGSLTPHRMKFRKLATV